MLILNNANRAALAQRLSQQRWMLACLCAEWCTSCQAYARTFATLAERWPDVDVVWIDIEDQADLVGDLDIENFPTLLIMQGDAPLFFGTVLPEVSLAERLLRDKLSLSPEEIIRQSSKLQAERQAQSMAECNLLQLLRQLPSAGLDNLSQ